MSVEAISWALRVPIGGTPKVILIGLANHATAELDHARPSIDTLATYAHVTPRNVQKALRDLEAEGWIQRTGGYAVQGRADRTVNVYRLVPERGVTGDTPRENGVSEATERGVAGDMNGVSLATPEPSIGTVHRKPSSSMSKIPNERERSDVDQLCVLLASLMKLNDPKSKANPASPNWRNAARLLLDRDERPLEEATQVLRWCQADNFWRGNILSMGKFRDKYATLRLQMGRNGNGSAKTSLSSMDDYHGIANQLRNGELQWD